MPKPTEPCKICSKPYEGHEIMKHQFIGDGDKVTSLRPNDGGQQSQSVDARKTQGSFGIASKGDPVLRLALIKAGVITGEDLDKVEAELRAVGFDSATPTRLA